MMSQPRKQTIAIYRLPDTSRSKGNQTMKFGQLMTWHDMKNIFLEKVIHKMWWGNYSQTLSYQN